MSIKEILVRLKLLGGRAAVGELRYPNGLGVRAACNTDAGGREENEDRCVIRIPDEGDPSFSRGWMAIVSDGMGGHNAGGIASQLVVDCVSKEYYEKADSPASSLRSALFAANRRILREARRSEQMSGMGATCTVLVGVGGRAFLGHVGDSRLYLLRNGIISLLTEDHSAAMDLVRRGLVSPSQARSHERRNIVLRALGVDQRLAITEWDTPLSILPGDRFILCTDGLTNTVDDEEILNTAGDLDCETACRSLIALATERRAADNVTAVVLDVFAQEHPAPDGQSSSSISEVTS
jgi:PPM family protein phosphatase